MVSKTNTQINKGGEKTIKMFVKNLVGTVISFFKKPAKKATKKAKVKKTK